MKVKFVKDAVYEIGGDPEKWPKYEAGKTYEFDDNIGERWLRRGHERVDAKLGAEVKATKPEPKAEEPKAEHSAKDDKSPVGKK